MRGGSIEIDHAEEIDDSRSDETMRVKMESLEAESEKWLAEVPQPLQAWSSTEHGPFVNWQVDASQIEDVKFKESFRRVSHWWETWALATTTRYLGLFMK